MNLRESLNQQDPESWYLDLSSVALQNLKPNPSMLGHDRCTPTVSISSINQSKNEDLKTTVVWKEPGSLFLFLFSVYFF
jgi:hypothetical protein